MPLIGYIIVGLASCFCVRMMYKAEIKCQNYEAGNWNQERNRRD